MQDTIGISVNLVPENIETSSQFCVGTYKVTQTNLKLPFVTFDLKNKNRFSKVHNAKFLIVL